MEVAVSKMVPRARKFNPPAVVVPTAQPPGPGLGWLFEYAVKGLLGGSLDQATITVHDRVVWNYFGWYCGTALYNCLDYDTVEKILTVYTNAVADSKLPPYKWNSDYDWAGQANDPNQMKVIEGVATYANVKSELVSQCLAELWWATQDGEISDGHKIIDPRGALKNAKVYENPKHVTSFDGAVEDIGKTSASIGKWLLIGAVVIGGLYVYEHGVPIYSDIKAGATRARDAARNVRDRARGAYTGAKNRVRDGYDTTRARVQAGTERIRTAPTRARQAAGAARNTFRETYQQQLPPSTIPPTRQLPPAAKRKHK